MAAQWIATDAFYVRGQIIQPGTPVQLPDIEMVDLLAAGRVRPANDEAAARFTARPLVEWSAVTDSEQT